VAQVYQWLGRLLTKPFYLYAAPPVTQHPPTETTLAAARLVPAKVLRLGWSSGAEPAPVAAPPPPPPPGPTEYLHPEALAAAAALAGGDHSAFAYIDGAYDEGGAVRHAAGSGGIDLASYGRGAEPSEDELEAMTRRLLAGEDPFTQPASGGGAGAGGIPRRAPGGTGGGAGGVGSGSGAGKPGGKPAWLRI